MSLSSVSAREELLHLQSCCHRAENQRLYTTCHAIVMAMRCAAAQELVQNLYTACGSNGFEPKAAF